MAFQRGDVVLIPFPFTDLSAAKTRPAIVVSSNVYHTVRSELLLAYVSSQLAKVNPLIDYPLTDWKAAGLPKPSFVRPKIAAITSLLSHSRKSFWRFHREYDLVESRICYNGK